MGAPFPNFLNILPTTGFRP